MTYDQVNKEYGCDVLQSPNHMSGSVLITFIFPDSFQYTRYLTFADCIGYSIAEIENMACEAAVDAYNNHKDNALPTESPTVSIPLFVTPEMDVGSNIKSMRHITSIPEPKLEISENYTIGFDISKEEDVSTATVCRVRGNRYEHVGTFTGEEAEWMYNRITNIKI